MKTLRLAGCALVATLQLCAATVPYHVRLELAIDDASLKNRVYSLVSREIRKLGDVEVSDDQPIHTLRITGIRLTTGTDRVETGFSLSVVVTRPVPVSENEGDKFWQEVYGKNPDQYLSAGLYANAPEKLEDACQQIVAAFDAVQMRHTRGLMSLIAAQLAKNEKAGPGK
jgi:hypothetical protein